MAVAALQCVHGIVHACLCSRKIVTDALEVLHSHYLSHVLRFTAYKTSCALLICAQSAEQQRQGEAIPAAPQRLPQACQQLPYKP